MNNTDIRVRTGFSPALTTYCLVQIYRPLQLAIWIICTGALMLVSGCSKDENESDKSNRDVEVFEEQERNKHWYESNFSTPYKEISSLKGQCLAWGMSGQCFYTFIANTAVVFRENQPLNAPSCTEIIGWLARNLKNKE
jgi:hypothetical protein